MNVNKVFLLSLSLSLNTLLPVKLFNEDIVQLSFVKFAYK